MFFALAACGFAGCNAALGLDERPERQTNGAGGTGSGGSSGALTCGQSCVASVPTGWSGPTAVSRGVAELSCGGAQPNVELALYDTIEAGPAVCDCSCGPATGIDCSATAFTLNIWDNNDCTNLRETPAAVVGQCVGTWGGMDSGSYVDAAPDLTAASCEPTTNTESVPPATWGDHLIGCGPVEQVDCAGSNCYAAPDGASLCIYQTGDQPCPDGPFSEREVWFANFVDTRVCEDCTCGTIDDAECNEVIVGYSEGNCSGNPAQLVINPLCTTAPVDFTSARVESVAPTGTCAPTGGTSAGTATPTSPTTVCCTPG